MPETTAISPLVAITSDIEPQDVTNDAGETRPSRIFSYPSYAQAVHRAGGIPVYLPQIAERIPEYLDHCDAFILTGGDDPTTEPFGEPTDPRVTPVQPEREAFELALLRALDDRPTIPVLGICLGMQYLALHAGGTLDQYMPDTCATHADHWNERHAIRVTPGSLLARASGDERDNSVWSKHKQRITDPGSSIVTARATDDTIEAIEDAHFPFRLGVQWHPERTSNDLTGDAIFRALIAAARELTESPRAPAKS